MQDCGTGILRLVKSCSCTLCYLPICIFLHKLSVPLFFLPRVILDITKTSSNICFYFFSEGTVTNPVIWLVLRAVRIFLSLPRGRVTFSWVAEYIPTFTNIFHKYISFFRLGNILSKDVGHNLKPINNLSFLSFLSLKSLWLSEKCLLRN